LPTDHSNVIQRVRDGGLPDVKFLGQNFVLSNIGSQFLFDVIDATFGIINGHHAFLNVLRKGASP
jgi:hypothetical protein